MAKCKKSTRQESYLNCIIHIQNSPILYQTRNKRNSKFNIAVMLVSKNVNQRNLRNSEKCNLNNVVQLSYVSFGNGWEVFYSVHNQCVGGIPGKN